MCTSSEMRRSLGATVLLAAALSGAVIAVDDADELLSKSQAITAVKTKGEVIAILCTTKEHAIANKKVFTQVQKSFEIAKNSVTFLWSKSTAVCDLWIPPLKNDDGEVEPRGLPAIILLAGIDDAGKRLRRNKKTQAVLRWPGSGALEDTSDLQNHLRDRTEYFVTRHALPLVTPVRGSDGNWIPGDGSVDAQGRLQLLMQSQLPKVFFLTNTDGVPEAITQAANGHRDDFVGVLLQVDDLKSAQTMFPSIGLSASEITSVYNDVKDGDLITVIVDPLDGRRSPMHHDIDGVDQFMTEFAEGTKARPTFTAKKAKKKTAKKLKKKKKSKRTADL